MKKIITVLTLTAALALAANAAEGDHKAEDAPAKKKSSVSAEKKAQKKELVDKYDANKNGKLDKEERSKMTPEDAEKWKGLSGAPKPKATEGDKKHEAKP